MEKLYTMINYTSFYLYLFFEKSFKNILFHVFKIHNKNYKLIVFTTLIVIVLTVGYHPNSVYFCVFSLSHRFLEPTLVDCKFLIFVPRECLGSRLSSSSFARVLIFSNVETRCSVPREQRKTKRRPRRMKEKKKKKWGKSWKHHYRGREGRSRRDS